MAKGVPKATHTGELKIGPVTIDCAVLEDGTRVLTQSGFLSALGQSTKPAGHRIGFEEVAPFLASNNLKPFVSKELTASTTKIRFSPFRGGRAVGYKAELLPQVCEVYLAARDAGVLMSSQLLSAAACDLLMRGFARLGIIGLVDEATGYQRVREERALATILERYIAKEFKPWSKTFPYEFYELIYKLKHWPGPDGHKRTPLIGQYTNDVVYDRLAPGVLAELKRLNPKLPTGRRKTTHHQWFTPDFGHPKLKEHLVGVMALMRAAPNWTVFTRSLQRAYPKLNETIPLPLDD